MSIDICEHVILESTPRERGRERGEREGGRGRERGREREREREREKRERERERERECECYIGFQKHILEVVLTFQLSLYEGTRLG